MATVIVWNNNLITTGHSIVGHAAINITDSWSQVQTASLDCYASFWPKDSAGLMSTRPADPTPNIFADLQIEGYVPDHIIRVNGLDTTKMLAKWAEIRSKAKVHYKMMRKNCSTIVARILKKGSKKGGTKRHNFIWTPLDVKRLALELGGQQLTWTNFLQELLQTNAIDQIGHNEMAKYKRREDIRGSSGATARFSNGQDSGKVTVDLEVLRFV